MDQLIQLASNPTLIILIACWEVLWTLTGLWYSAIRKDKYWINSIVRSNRNILSFHKNIFLYGR